ncbi:MAG: transcriptional regulator NrdR [candidate division WOR-3 bacterium]|nr:transcriptional regulator NrdR [candidate division WOR-3 bacterium]MCX7836983.1 transcriptional regulator NrdR [candidate division WOR-3 bacterium]MDW8114061.1 transcriptional regulator NrdR [candidate division WOR-3 bacterium]
MKCPNCGVDNDRVIDSRPVLGGEAIRRRRECLGCGQRFTTFEYIEQIPLMVIKSDGRREPYNREKLIKGIVLACRKRPVSQEKIQEIVNLIEKEMIDNNQLEIESKYLGERVLEYLKKIDEVAYVRFASVYKNFQSIDEFIKEIKEIKKEEKNGEIKK